MTPEQIHEIMQFAGSWSDIVSEKDFSDFCEEIEQR
ncbi:MAG: hypothetical protein RLZZ535_355 [Cyanobacteriota bacterium]|jgi:hypothetical protein